MPNKNILWLQNIVYISKLKQISFWSPTSFENLKMTTNSLTVSIFSVLPYSWCQYIRIWKHSHQAQNIFKRESLNQIGSNLAHFENWSFIENCFNNRRKVIFSSFCWSNLSINDQFSKCVKIYCQTDKFLSWHWTSPCVHG